MCGQRIQTDRTKWTRVPTLLGLVLVGYICGRSSQPHGLHAAPPEGAAAASNEPPLAPPSHSDYSRRVVAYIHGNIPITREELGEYLIARYGAAKLPLLVNHRIIDLACQQAGIEVTNAEIEAALAEDLGRLSVNQKDFVEKILRQYNKTLFEWKEDVIRPRLQLGKLCRQQVRVEEEDLKKAFEAHYGEKVECRIIMWPRHEEKIALKEYEALRDSEEAFEHKATHQASGQLSATGGRIAPFGRHTTGNEELEKEAFRLQPGELSRLIGTPEGFVVLKLVRRIPADDKVKLADVRSKLEAEIIEKKVQMKIRDVFNELSAKANPKLFLKDHDKESDIIREVQTELQSNPPRPEGK